MATFPAKEEASGARLPILFPMHAGTVEPLRASPLEVGAYPSSGNSTGLARCVPGGPDEPTATSHSSRFDTINTGPRDFPSSHAGWLSTPLEPWDRVSCCYPTTLRIPRRGVRF